jgi:plastocyanin
VIDSKYRKGGDIVLRTTVCIILVALLLPAAALAAEHGSMADEVERVYAVPGEDGVQRAVMTGGDYFFKPRWLVLRLGVPVELTVKKEPGFVPHNIVMDAPEAGMAFEVDFGKKGEVISFTPTKKGTYIFYCSKKLLFFKSHRDRGMEGIIEVVE